MARKHVQEYYDKISNDYTEMVHTLEELQESGVPKENVEQIKAVVDNLKENFQRWSYMMFLLNMPARKEKESRYRQQNKKLLAKIGNNTAETELKENQEAIAELNKYRA